MGEPIKQLKNPRYFYELTISSSPHAHSPVTTQTIMRDVLIALAPALIVSIFLNRFCLKK